MTDNTQHTIFALLVDVIEHIAWPVAVILVAWMFRGGITSALRQLFSKSSLKEFRAGGAGISATFEAERQVSAEAEDETTRRAGLLPPGQSYEEIRAKQEPKRTPHSDRINQYVVQHIDALGVDDQKKIELLTSEVAILHTSVQVLDVAKVLVRSQFDLFAELRDGGGQLSVKEASQHFKKVSSADPDAYAGWDYIKYLSYPTAADLIEYKEGRHVLTEFGMSFVDVMRKAPRLIDDLAPI